MSKFIDPIGQPFKFPQSLINQISEVTNGNFIIFFPNNGKPDYRVDFQDEINELAMRSYITTFMAAINQSEDISKVQSMLNDEMPPEDFDGGEEDFGKDE